MSRSTLVALLLSGLAFGGAGEAWAGINVNPVKIELSSDATSTLLTVTNQDERIVRFQVDVSAWEQAPDGEVRLAPTEDIVFFPVFLVLNPKDSGKIRIGSTAKPGRAEKTYRIVLEELPPAELEEVPGVVSVRAVISIPIFLAPAEKKLDGDLSAALAAGKVSVEVRNRGSVHFIPTGVRLRALDKSGKPIAEKGFESWYVLAGGHRVYETDLSKKDCARVAALEVEAMVGDKPVKRRVDVPKPSCGR